MNSLSSLSDIYKIVVENCVDAYNISDSARDLWLDQLVPIQMDGNKVTLATDVEFKRDTIRDFYL